jgi:hypothetical protein
MSSTEDRLRGWLSAAADSVQASDGAWAENAERVRRDRRARRVVPASLAVVVLGASLAVWRIPDWNQEQSPVIVGVTPTASPSTDGKSGNCDKPWDGVTAAQIADGSPGWSVAMTVVPDGSLLCYTIKVDQADGSVTGEGAIQPTFVKGREVNAFPYLSTTAVGDTSWLIGAVEDPVKRVDVISSDGSRWEVAPLYLNRLRAFAFQIGTAADGRHPVQLTAVGADEQVLGEVGIAEDSR